MSLKRSILVVALVSASTSFACWQSSFAPYICHENDSTCGSEPTQRACWICCSAFNGSIFTPGGVACAQNCPTNNDTPGGGDW